jgi:hypothetical protein
MDGRTYLVMFITRALASTFLYLAMRRDRGGDPVDGLAEALHETMNRRPKA